MVYWLHLGRALHWNSLVLWTEFGIYTDEGKFEASHLLLEKESCVTLFVDKLLPL